MPTSRRFKKIFGYWNASGIPKKIVKLSGKKATDGYLLELSIIQYDVKFFHFSLHNSCVAEKSTRYHIQADYPELIADEDRKKFPELSKSQLPDFRSSPSLFHLQAIPIFAKADDELNFYPVMSDAEIKNNPENMANYKDINYDRSTPGLLELYLVPQRAISELKEFEERVRSLHGKIIRLWKPCTDVIPYIYCYISQAEKE